MKKKINRIISIILFAIMIITAFSACKGDDNVFVLNTPQNLHFENGIIKWDKVEKADEYIVSVNKEQYIVAGTTFTKVTANTLYEISVRARNVWTSSEWSETIKGKVLETPTNCVYFNGKFYYDVKEGATSYLVNIDGEEYSLESGGVSTFDFYEAGNKTAKIKAVGDNINYFDSTYSEDIIVRITDKQWSDIEIQTPAGSGSANSPYKINNIEHVKWLSTKNAENNEQFKGRYFQMYFDIDFRLVSGYLPIGSLDSPFLGNFNGAGNSFYFLNVYSNYAGIFGCIGEGAEVRNLGNVSGKVNGISSAGGIAASNLGLILNCSNSSSIKANVAGGIVAENTDSKIVLMCANYGAVTGENVGGIAGWNWNGSINKCVNNGAISGVNNAGGIVGTNAGNVFYCENYGDITSANAGGLTASNIGYIKISSNSGIVLSSKLGGGLTATNSGTIKYSYNAGYVVSNSAQTNSYIGGIAGKIDDGKIIVCYNVGKVSFIIDSAKKVGQIVGYYRSGLLDKCYLYYGNTPVGNSDKYIGECLSLTQENFTQQETVDLFNSLVSPSDVLISEKTVFKTGSICPVFYWQNN